jgi:hypothetical protein
MYQLGTKDLEVLVQLFQLMFDLLFEVGGLGDFVTKMNVHASLSGRIRSHRSYLALGSVYSCFPAVKREMKAGVKLQGAGGQN